MQLFDTHCHIDLDAFAADRVQVLAAARAAGVTELLVPGVQRTGWAGLIDLCAHDAQLHLALGLHPVYLAQHSSDDVEVLADLVTRVEPVAIGEIGLDWQIDGLDRKRQQRLLEDQLAVAEASRLPVVLHVRKAHDRMLETLKRYELRGGFCHAFNGSLQQAERYQALGFRLGFGGMLTYERSRRLRQLARELPLPALVLETDAPDMTGAAHQYQRNSPAYLPEVQQTLAELRGADPAEIAAVTRANAREVLGLDRAE
jgi:TatD DNase family protein